MSQMIESVYKDITNNRKVRMYDGREHSRFLMLNWGYESLPQKAGLLEL